MARSAPRVVSLVPSVTEALLAWGVEPVACTRFCEQPSIRHVGGTKDPDVAAIVALAPDLVVMCDEENRAEDAGRSRPPGSAPTPARPGPRSRWHLPWRRLAAALHVAPPEDHRWPAPRSSRSGAGSSSRSGVGRG